MSDFIGSRKREVYVAGITQTSGWWDRIFGVCRFARSRVTSRHVRVSSFLGQRRWGLLYHAGIKINKKVTGLRRWEWCTTTRPLQGWTVYFREISLKIYFRGRSRILMRSIFCFFLFFSFHCNEICLKLNVLGLEIFIYKLIHKINTQVCCKINVRYSVYTIR